MNAGSGAAVRNAAVLIWVPVLLAGAAVELRSAALPVLDAVALLVAAAACVGAVVLSWPRPSSRSTLASAALAGVVLIASLVWPGWAPAWLLVAMTVGVALPGLGAAAGIAVAAVASALTLARAEPDLTEKFSQGFVVSLAGTTAAVISRLVLTSERLQRTREQLAVTAVARERERVARDLHDLLGHTLSVMVVKAAAARRLIPTDPDAAVAHVADIEQVGRTALGQVRATIQDAAPPTLGDELASARDMLDAAGIEAVISPDGPPVEPSAGAPLAWALRESVTNVVRHSGASQCRIELTRVDDMLRLTVADDGVGPPAAAPVPTGGLGGLRRRLLAVGGDLDVAPDREGFTLHAWVPDRAEP